MPQTSAVTEPLPRAGAGPRNDGKAWCRQRNPEIAFNEATHATVFERPEAVNDKHRPLQLQQNAGVNCFRLDSRGCSPHAFVWMPPC